MSEDRKENSALCRTRLSPRKLTRSPLAHIFWANQFSAGPARNRQWRSMSRDPFVKFQLSRRRELRWTIDRSVIPYLGIHPDPSRTRQAVSRDRNGTWISTSAIGRDDHALNLRQIAKPFVSMTGHCRDSFLMIGRLAEVTRLFLVKIALALPRSLFGNVKLGAIWLRCA